MITFFEIKYSFSKIHGIPALFIISRKHMADQATNYKASTGRKAAAILLVVTLEDQVTQIEKYVNQENAEIESCYDYPSDS